MAEIFTEPLHPDSPLAILQELEDEVAADYEGVLVEVDRREEAGYQVAWLLDRLNDGFVMRIDIGLEEEALTIPVAEEDRPIAKEIFEHPFNYAAQKGMLADEFTLDRYLKNAA